MADAPDRAARLRAMARRADYVMRQNPVPAPSASTTAQRLQAMARRADYVMRNTGGSGPEAASTAQRLQAMARRADYVVQQSGGTPSQETVNTLTRLQAMSRRADYTLQQHPEASRPETISTAQRLQAMSRRADYVLRQHPESASAEAAANAARGGGKSVGERFRGAYERVAGGVRAAAGQARDAAGRAVAGARGSVAGGPQAAADAARTARETAAGAAGRVQEAASGAYQRAREKVSGAYQRARENVTSIGGALRDARSRVSEDVAGAKAEYDRQGGAGGAVGRKIREAVAHFTSPAGHAELKRHGLGIVDNWIAQKAFEAQRAHGIKGAIMRQAFKFAREHLGKQMASLGNDQRLFENTAKVRDGRHQELSNRELLEVHEKAEKYGGHHAPSIISRIEQHLEFRAKEGGRAREEAITSARIDRAQKMQSQRLEHAAELMRQSEGARDATHKQRLRQEAEREVAHARREAKRLGFSGVREMASWNAEERGRMGRQSESLLHNRDANTIHQLARAGLLHEAAEVIKRGGPVPPIHFHVSSGKDGDEPPSPSSKGRARARSPRQKAAAARQRAAGQGFAAQGRVGARAGAGAPRARAVRDPNAAARAGQARAQGHAAPVSTGHVTNAGTKAAASGGGGWSPWQRGKRGGEFRVSLKNPNVKQYRGKRGKPPGGK